jgi:hypothetical protein
MGRIWLLEQVPFAPAGSMTLLSVVSPRFPLLAAFGLDQRLSVTAGPCPASLALGRIGVERRCPR